MTSVTVTWAAPSNAGPPITSYDLQYRIMGTSGGFTVGPQDVSGLSEPIPGLEENTAYEVQVLATNAEGDSDWSEAGQRRDGRQRGAGCSPRPRRSPRWRTRLEAGTITATDGDSGDSVTGYTIAGGADAVDVLDPRRLTGELTFTSAPNFEAPTDADTATTTTWWRCGRPAARAQREKTADQPIAVTVTDEAGEAPDAPAAPDGDGGVGDECDGDLGCALERGAADHELRPAIPHHGHQRGLHRRPAGRERVERADPGA